MTLVGIDLAWGERNPDGVCLVRGSRRAAAICETALVRGDDELLAWIAERTGGAPALLTVDAPLVIPNATGTRPVDRETHRRFHAQHAACHPANSAKCPRPLRLVRRLRARGWHVGWDLARHQRVVAEVYPHPAIVRLLGLERIIKYKRGPVAARRAEFARLQDGLRKLLATRFPALTPAPAIRKLLREPWSKPVEDRTDALVCAIIGYLHWQARGRHSEVMGDRQTGFILLPK